MNPKDLIEQGKTALGIEFGSTRIKGVLTDYDGNVLATGGYEWENSLVDGVWTYGLDEAERGLQGCYSALRKDVVEKYGVTPKTFGAWGIALLAAYMADGRKEGKLEDYLEKRIFAGLTGDAVEPDPAEVEGFEIFAKRYVAGLEAEKAAIAAVDW